MPTPGRAGHDEPMGRVRWAIAGFGKGGQVYHAPLVASAAELEFVAVVTGNAERAAAAADRWKVPAVSSVDDLPGLGVQGVTVTTPSATHVSVAQHALRLGLAVVVDKPMTLTAADGRALLATAQKSGLPLSVYQNRRWDSEYLTVVDLVRSGRLGWVHRMISRIDRIDRNKPVKPGWANASVADGGGQLYDLGSHLIDQALHLFGPVCSVHADLLAVRTGAVGEDDFEVHLHHLSGVHSTVAAGLANPAAGPRFLINGSAGGFRVEAPDIQESQVQAGGTPASLGDAWGVEPESSWGTLWTADGPQRWPSARGSWDSFYPAMAAAVVGGGPVPVDPTDAAATAEVIDAARISATTGQVVAFPARALDFQS